MKYLYSILLFTVTLSMASYSQDMKEAYFAGGCFWCMEQPFEEAAGVEAAVSGFAGGEEESPSYKDVASGKTGHREAVRVTTAIFYTSDTEMAAAESSKDLHEEKGTFTDPIVTEILPLTTFYRAGDDHQDYYKNHKFKYKYYRKRSGRDEYLKKIWD